MAANNMTRRSFVKASTLATAATAMGVTMSGCLAESEEDQVAEEKERIAVHTACHGCIQLCPCIAYLEDGIVVKLEGDPRAPESKGSMCLKGMSQLHTVYSPRHVLHPMKRVGPRGTNEWEVISWDEAIDYAGEQIALAMQKYGPYAYMGGTGGGGFYNSHVISPFSHALGAPNGAISPGACQCWLPRVTIADNVYGGGMQGNQSIADHANNEPFNEYSPKIELQVLWGAQPSTSQVAQSGRGMADLRVGRGVKTIVIDPVFTPDAAKADIWLPVRPGYDTGLILSWFRYIIENNLWDEDFCKYWTNLPFIINPDTELPYKAEEIWPDYVNPALDPNDVISTPAYVCFDEITGELQPLPYTAPEDCPVNPRLLATVEINGKTCKSAAQLYWEEAEPWTLEHVEEVCWTPADRNKEAIELYAKTEYANICHGVFSDMMNCSSQVPLGTLGLEVITGRVYKPGSSMTMTGARPTERQCGWINYSGGMYGVGWNIGWTKAQNDRALDAQVQALNERGVDGEAMREQWHQITIDRMGGLEYRGMLDWGQAANGPSRIAMTTGDPYPIKCWFDCSGNKLAMFGDVNKWIEVRETQDFIVHEYPNMTSFDIELSDLFLPVYEWLEWEGGSGADMIATMNYMWLRQRVIHLGETAHNKVVIGKVLDSICEHLGGEDKVYDRERMRGVCFSSTEEMHENWAPQWGCKTWDEVLERQDELNPRVIPPEAYWQYYQHEDIAPDGLPVGFKTLSRKVEPYATVHIHSSIDGFPYTYPFTMPEIEHRDAICKFIEPVETPENTPEYPLTLTSGRVPHFHHGTMRHAPFTRELYPAPEVLINPATAKGYGIESGDWVKVFNSRGDAHGIANVCEAVAPGVIFMERFWNPECFDDSQETISGGWQECNVNCLTLEGPGNEFFSSQTYRAFQVDIEKSTRPDRIWVEPEEFEPFMPTLMNEPQTEVVF
ncbi:molybdopterin-dependent oxidoreductase [Denitrobacterium detoxificans]|uniref:molybdopterin-containing oxidoreductase family protein n=1 Tax=Denitrobacterium detoxificans TaxID=79604 RepID=UPI0026EF57B2|nr:molybdopterin-dependent oxidoreductase [Denitrobacterium detoxificans]MBE6466765.1 molybdopterin dinucleotide-binding protein [Denitrobacterium detoxificans]